MPRTRAELNAKPNRKIADTFRREAGDFDNQRRIQYQEAREAGLPTPAPTAEQVRVGSGMVESACMN